MMVPEGDPAQVICMNNVRMVDALGRPLGVPFRTYQAPPVLSLMRTLVPESAEEALNLPNQGCPELSTVEMATWLPVGAFSIPMVTQLSNAMAGTSARNIGLMPSAVEPVAKGLLWKPEGVLMDNGAELLP